MLAANFSKIDMPKKTPATRSVTKKGDEGLAELMSPGVLAKVGVTQVPKDSGEEKSKLINAINTAHKEKQEEEIATVDFESLLGAAFIAIGVGILIGLAFAFIMRDASVAEMVQEASLADMIPQ
jgi:hypothetical protein